MYHGAATTIATTPARASIPINRGSCDRSRSPRHAANIQLKTQPTRPLVRIESPSRTPQATARLITPNFTTPNSIRGAGCPFEDFDSWELGVAELGVCVLAELRSWD